ncbi:MAG: peptidylprolyl isomerase [Pseudomonadales bacterium]|nr:peptidylprolyl isomerase [Pseudomonadales bacterium]
MTTSEGEIEIELYLDRAPITAGNFLRLVEGGHFDGSSFYRTVTYDNDNGSPKIEVIQGGPNQGDGPFPPIAHESTEQTGILHLDGVVSMSRGEVGTASTEIFICIGDQPGLDYGQPRNADMQGFAAFGRVVRGMDVVSAINNAATDQNSYLEYTRGQQISEPVMIETVVRI